MTKTNQNPAPPADTEPVPFVSPVVGEGAEAYRMIRLGDFEFRDFCDNVPRVRDIDLAVRLDFKTPRMIRKLIKAMEKNGELPDIRQRSTVERYESRPGVWQSRTINEYWLTEAEALLVTIRSETPKALEVRAAMVKLWITVRKAIEGGAALAFDDQRVRALIAEHADRTNAELVALRIKVESLTETTSKLDPMSSHLIGPKRAHVHILSQINKAAKIRFSIDPTIVEASWRARIDAKIRTQVGYNKMVGGSRWEVLPMYRMGDAERCAKVAVEEALAEFHAKTQKTWEERQTSMFGDKVGDKVKDNVVPMPKRRGRRAPK